MPSHDLWAHDDSDSEREGGDGGTGGDDGGNGGQGPSAKLSYAQKCKRKGKEPMIEKGEKLKKQRVRRDSELRF